MGHPRRRALLGVAIVAAAALAVVAISLVTLGVFGEDPDEAAARYAQAWSRGDDRAAARETDRPDEALEALAGSRRGLDGARVRAEVEDVSEDGDRADALLRVSWRVPRIGEFAYDTRVPLVEADDGWQIEWRAANVHPRLDDKTRLGTMTVGPPRASILDRDGRPLMSNRPVVDVAVRTDRVEDAGETAAALAELVDVDADRLERTIRDAGEGRFVPVITLRQSEFRADAERIKAIPGVSTSGKVAPLAPSRAFARALLGVVGPATAEQVERSRGRVSGGDEIGQWGLQAAFEERLAGTPTSAVVVRERKTGTQTRTLMRKAGKRGQPVRTTLERAVQDAAEDALSDVDDNAALVAVRPSTGEVLAVANRPVESSFNRAFDGLYPPGSTFKVVTTAALLRDGLGLDDVVDCPATVTVEGKAFRNFEGGAAGAVPFREDFAESCNTAFVSLHKRITADRLTLVARDYGLGVRTRLPVSTTPSKVPPAPDAVGRAAMMIGQAETVASPLAMAGVAAAVADGRWRAPRLVSTDRPKAGRALPPEEVESLRTLMRAVVVGGTGVALGAVPGEPAGKSGTAEYGGGDPPKTHAWFIAFRGDLAVAVLVEGGRAGGEVAAPIAARFLTAAPLA